MKNLIKKGFLAIAISAALSSCDNASDPQPTQQVQANQSESKTTNTQSKLSSRFQWKLVKTGVFGNGERVKLKAPFAMGYMVGGDIAYENQNGRGALVPLSVKFYNLRSLDKSTVDPAMLNTVRFNSYTIPAADGTDVDNVLYTHTHVAIKDANGKYYILEAEKFLINHEIKVNIYEESSFAPHARLPYELPD